MAQDKIMIQSRRPELSYLHQVEVKAEQIPQYLSLDQLDCTPQKDNEVSKLSKNNDNNCINLIISNSDNINVKNNMISTVNNSKQNNDSNNNTNYENDDKIMSQDGEKQDQLDYSDDILAIFQSQIEKNNSMRISQNQKTSEKNIFYTQENKIKNKNAVINENQIRQNQQKLVDGLQAKIGKLNIGTGNSAFCQPCLSSQNKTEQRYFDCAMNKLKDDLDIINILKKLHDVEKLKNMLLNDQQKLLFDFIAKPTLNIEDVEFEEKRMKDEKVKGIHFNKSHEAQKICDAYIAFKQICNKPQLSDTDNKVIELLEPTIQFYFTKLTQIEKSAPNVLNSPF